MLARILKCQVWGKGPRGLERPPLKVGTPRLQATSLNNPLPGRVLCNKKKKNKTMDTHRLVTHIRESSNR